MFYDKLNIFNKKLLYNDGHILMNESTKTEELIIDESQLLSHFHMGVKPRSDFKIGIELEKLGVNPNNYTAAPYSGPNGILEFLKRYKKDKNWDYITENNKVLGLISGCDTVTLEPGSQTELSSCPRNNIHDIADQIKGYNSETAELAEELGIYWLGYGIQPLSTHENIELIPKERYNIMTEYLPAKGNMALVMMRETAGIQVSLDYGSEEDAAYKLKVLNGLSPIVTSMFANSPIRGGHDTGYKSYRSIGWLRTDEARCGLISKKIFESDFSFKDYVDVLLDLPMMFLCKDHKWVNMQGMTFRQYMQHGYENYKATMEDWNLHKSSFFPNIRLNHYLEIRNCDCQRADLIPAVPALWKGLIYDNDAMSAAWDLIKDLTWEDRHELRSLVPKYALEAEIKGLKVIDIAKELVNIADYSLKQMAQLNTEEQDESVYLTELKALLSKKHTPADEILSHWYSDWNKDFKQLIEYLRLT
ncbi:MAG: hypothetical protein ACD_20C00094G0002 [uncultured bacterium]|nr:MAG: hypothetical protein ACD_20C00094G0002 [uncultured bacterium]HBH17792.1 hypothetical protein [Cyanobacteria bacterium UBA9579]